jgi:hypothetical protein
MTTPAGASEAAVRAAWFVMPETRLSFGRAF